MAPAIDFYFGVMLSSKAFIIKWPGLVQCKLKVTRS